MDNSAKPLVLLENALQKLHIDTQLTAQENDNGKMDLLQFLLPVDEDGHEVFFQVCTTDLQQDFTIVEFFATIVADYGSYGPEIGRVLDTLNLHAAMGCYGITPTQETVFHRQNVLLENDLEETTVFRLLWDSMEMIRWEIGRRLLTLWSMAAGELNAQEALAQGRFD